MENKLGFKDLFKKIDDFYVEVLIPIRIGTLKLEPLRKVLRDELGLGNFLNDETYPSYHIDSEGYVAIYGWHGPV